MIMNNLFCSEAFIAIAASCGQKKMEVIFSGFLELARKKERLVVNKFWEEKL